MENYNKSIESYYATLRCISGSGAISQYYTNNAYQKLLESYNLLSEYDKSKVRLPEKKIYRSNECTIEKLMFKMELKDTN